MSGDGTQRDFAQGLQEYMAHVATHPEDALQGAICIVVSEDRTGKADYHLCRFVGGDEELMADSLFDLTRELVDNLPTFAKRFNERAQEAVIQKVTKLIDEGLKQHENAAKTEEIAESLMERLKKGPVQ